MCEVDQETEDGQVELVDVLEEPSELSMTVGEGDTGFVFLNGKDTFFKIEGDAPNCNKAISGLVSKADKTIALHYHRALSSEMTDLNDGNTRVPLSVRLWVTAIFSQCFVCLYHYLHNTYINSFNYFN